MIGRAGTVTAARASTVVALAAAWAFVATTADVRAAAPPGGGYAVRAISLTEPGSYYVTTSTGVSVNAAGQVAGASMRSAPDGEPLGRDVWFFDGTTTHALFLTGAEYQRPPFHGPGVYRWSSGPHLNDAGQVLGETDRYHEGSYRGGDVWLYDGTGAARIVGLTGPGYSYAPAAGGVFHDNNPHGIDNNGRMIGSANRYSSSGTLLGLDAWIDDGTGPRAIGLTGAPYEYAHLGGAGNFRSSLPVAFTPAGHVLGNSTRFLSNGASDGSDAWLFDGTTTRLVSGLSGTVYENGRRTFVGAIDAAGRMAGTSARRSSGGEHRGWDAWFNNGSTIRQINLTGLGYEYGSGPTYRFGAPHEASKISQAGHVFGHSDRFGVDGTDLGQDAWVFNGAITRVVGLTGGVYEFNSAAGLRRSSIPRGFNAAGQAIGSSDRYYGPNANNLLGTDSWFYDGASTRRTNLTGPGYEYTSANGVHRESDARALNAAGQVIGTSARYTSDGLSLGTAGWFFDGATGVTTPLLFSLSADDRSGTDPQFVSDQGVVLGRYDRWSGADFLGTHAFWWHLDAGFHDLGALAGAALTDDAWQRFESTLALRGTFPGGAPHYIVATGSTPGQSQGNTAFLLTAQVPEPGSALGVLLASAILLTRSRGPVKSPTL